LKERKEDNIVAQNLYEELTTKDIGELIMHNN